ncbi:LysE family transporter [Vibrio owensii]|uniref:LysE family translocator n=1 Tax=Vibrio owensii TaxID=696485 RepID=UPI002F413AA1
MIQTPEMTAFLLLIFLYAFMPGPAMLYSVGQTLSCGKRAGILSVIGLHLGGYFHVVLSAVCLSSAFVLSPTIFEAMKHLGAVYLIWLGTTRIYKAQTQVWCEKQQSGCQHDSDQRVFVDGIITNIVFSCADLLSVLLASRLRAALLLKHNAWIYLSKWAGSIFILLGLLAVVN